MKKATFLLALVLMSLPVLSQGKKYTKSMQKAMKMQNKADNPESAQECLSLFEEISENYADQWIPSYMAARILVNMSFDERDVAKSDQLLKRASAHLDHARELAPEESEIEVMRAMYYIGLISSDPESRGPVYYQDALISIDKSKKLNPENPRAWYLDGMMTLNMPEFLGGGPEAARPIFLKAAEKFDSYENEDPLWPDWGEDLVQEELSRMTVSN